MKLIHKYLYGATITFLMATPSLGFSSLAKENHTLAEMVQRIDTLEKQIKILEENLPKRIRKLPLELPHVTSNGAIQETMLRLHDMLNLNFIEYHQQIHGNRQFCTEDSFKHYVQFIEKSGWISQISKNKMLLYIRPSSAPRILHEGAKDNKYAWKIEIPFIAFMENINETTQKNMIATVEIQRASELAHPLGILITAIDFKEQKS